MPISRIPAGRLRYLFVPALVVYVLAFVPFLILDSGEIVPLELAGTSDNAREIVSGWSAAQTADVAFLQGVDAVHPLGYGLMIAAGAIWAGRRLRGRAAGWAGTFAWMAIAAMVFDTIENVGMIAMIRGNVDAPIPALTTAFAIAKFSLIIVCLLYVIAGLIARLRGIPRAT